MKKQTDRNQRSELAQTMRYLSLVGHLGLVMIFSVGGGLIAGLFMDRWLETKAIFTVLLLLVGVGSGFTGIYQVISKMEFSSKGFNNDEKSGINDAYHEDDPDDSN